MRRKQVLVIGLLALSLGITSCKPTVEPSEEPSTSTSAPDPGSSSEVPEPKVVIESVALSNKATLKSDMYVGDTQTLTFAVSAKKGDKAHEISVADAFAQKLIAVTSSDEAVLTVGEDGKVSALAFGEATIKIAAVADPAKKDELKISVFTKDVRISAASVVNYEEVLLPNIALDEAITLELSISALRGRDEVVAMTSAEALADGLITLSSSDEEVLSLAGTKITGLKVGASTLKIVDKAAKVLFEQEVKVVERNIGALTLILNGAVDNAEAFEGEEMALPSFVAYDKNGNDVSAQVTVVDSLGEEVAATDTVFAFDVVGEHIISYKLKIGEDEVVKSVKRNVYMHVLGDGGQTWDTILHDELTFNPSVTTKNQGQFIRDFYMPKSKQYYVEWEYAAEPILQGDKLLTAAHYTFEQKNLEDSPFNFMGLMVKDGGSDWEVAHGKLGQGWNAIWQQRMWSDKSVLRLKGGADLDPRNKAWKMATARDGDALYYFINDQLINVEYVPEFFDVDTKPGILTHGQDAAAPGTTLSKFVKLQGSAVSAKINSLMPETLFYYFTNWGNSDSADLATFGTDGFVYKAEIATENMDDWNNSVVTNSVLLGLGAEVSFDLQASHYGNDGGWGKFGLSVRTVHDKKNIVEFGLVGGGDNYTEAYLGNSEVGSANTNLFDGLKEALGSLPSKGKYHITLKMEYEDYEEESYTITVVNAADESKVFTRTLVVEYTSEAWTFGSAKFLNFHAQKWAGEISNFKVSYN